MPAYIAKALYTKYRIVISPCGRIMIDSFRGLVSMTMADRVNMVAEAPISGVAEL